ncbi:MAG TPA: adenosylhomocysteinase [candidate division Zixibacteria bacterium]|nr:adenosylhomocysteinase [candidate division Zixibacteria bacterium]
MNKVKDLSLIDEGLKELEWAEKNMPVLSAIKKRFEKELPFKGLKISVALHLEKKTGQLIRTLKSGGATIRVASCNPLTTDDRVAAALTTFEGIEVFAWANQDTEEYYENLNSVLDSKPNLLIDDGADLINIIHFKRPELIEHVIGASEETTTGIIRLKAMEKESALKFPIMNANGAYSKHLFDNRFGTGQSALNAIMSITNKLIAGKNVVIVGYGWCGRGLAARARGMGARTIVVEAGDRMPYADETEPSGWHKGLEALYEGFEVMNIEEAAKIGDLFITATGDKHVIDVNHIELMKDGAMLANAGHFDLEINIKGLEKSSKIIKEINWNCEEYTLNNGKRIYLLSQGRLVNLARPAGQGHPLEIMDGSFAIQALALEYVAKKGKDLPIKVITMPVEMDDYVAKMVLESHNIRLHPLTKEQRDYLTGFKEGT